MRAGLFRSRRPPKPYCPVPVSESPCGLAALLSNNCKVADSFPTTDGVKYTVNIHVSAGSSEPPQGGSPTLVMKSVGMAPVRAAPVNVMVCKPTLVMVTVAVACVPTVTLPKFNGDGLNSNARPYSRQSYGLRAGRIGVRYAQRSGHVAGGGRHEFRHQIRQVPLFAMDLPLVQVVELVVRNGPVTDTAGLPRVMAAPLLFVSTIRVEVLVVPIAWAGNTAAAGAKDTLLVPVPVIPAN